MSLLSTTSRPPDHIPEQAQVQDQEFQEVRTRLADTARESGRNGLCPTHVSRPGQLPG
jgi:hypothetical protein